MTRLNKHMRREIVANAVKASGVSRLREELIPVRAKLAGDIRVHALGGPAKARKVDDFARSFPDLVTTRNSVVAVVGGPVYPLYFNGAEHEWKGAGHELEVEYLPSASRRVSLPEDSRLGKRVLALAQKEEQLREREEAVARGARAMVDSVATVKKLLEVWPEAAELVPEKLAPEKQLPAVPVGELNTLIGLPSDG